MGARLFGFRDTKGYAQQQAATPVDQRYIPKFPWNKEALLVFSAPLKTKLPQHPSKFFALNEPQTIEWKRAEHRYPPGFYTYRLLDPRDGVVFYVGKGQRSRAWQHDALVKRGDVSGNQRKVAKILEIVGAGREVEIEIVACYLLESDALNHEFRLVDENPTLTNIMPGGLGAPLSQADHARKVRLRAEKVRRLREIERVASEKAEVEVRRSIFLDRARTPQERFQIEAWLNEITGPLADKLIRPCSTALAQKETPQGRRAAGNPHKIKRPTSVPLWAPN